MAIPKQDSLESDCSPIDNPMNKNYITLINNLSKFLLDNRDALGYPLGTDNLPYLIVTNDVSNKVLEMIKLCLLNKDKLDSKTFSFHAAQWMKLLSLSYDELENEKSKGCCALNATKISREQAQEFVQKFENCQ